MNVETLGDRWAKPVESPRDPPDQEAWDEVPEAEPVVLVLHGWYADAFAAEVTPRPVHAALLTQSTFPAAPDDLEAFREALLAHKQCDRVFGLRIGWNQFGSRDEWELVRQFLESDEEEPSDPRVARWLGTDSPVVRMELEFALEVALAALGEPAAERPAPAVLLGPALRAAATAPGLSEITADLSAALDSRPPAADWPGLIRQALDRLRSATAGAP